MVRVAGTVHDREGAARADAPPRLEDFASKIPAPLRPELARHLNLKSDVLPPGIKQKVGMLKLVENKSFVRDIGYRMDSNTFFVLEDT